MTQSPPSGTEGFARAEAATVTAMSHMISYAISRDRLRALVEKNPVAREWMLEEMRRRYPHLA